ncbi:MAG: hypothetical protein V2A73_04730, partial [Pseudomonadota bacterium]
MTPRLREHGSWLVLRLRPGSDPFGALASCLTREPGKGETDLSSGSIDLRVIADDESGLAVTENSAASRLAASLQEKPLLLNVVLHQLAEKEGKRVLLFVDQLEEAFTLVRDEDTRRRFVEALCRGEEYVRGPVRVVVTVRDDFLGHVTEGAERGSAFERIFVLRRPGPQMLEQMLVQPVLAMGYRFDDPHLVAEMVAAVQGEPACLPLLQFAGQMLWERRDTGRQFVLRSAYQAIGGVAGALAEHADGVLAGLGSDQIQIARELMLALVTPEGTRRVVPTREVQRDLGEDGKTVLGRLVGGRLVTLRKGGGGEGADAVVELAHESLIHAWRQLVRWLEESKEERVFLAEVEQAAKLWVARGRRDEEVWQGDALADARRKLIRLATKVPEQVAEFLQAGLRKEQRRRRRRRGLAAGTMAFLTIVSVLSVLRERETRAQKERAESERAEAQAQRALAKEGEAEAQREGASAALGRGELVEARARLRSSLETQDSILGRALWRKLDRDPLEWNVDLGRSIYDIAYAPDGRTVAAGCQDGLVHVVNTDTTETSVLRGASAAALAVAYSPDGRFLASGHGSGEVVIWNLAAGDFRVLTGHDIEVRRVAVSPDSRHLASASSDRTARIFALPAGELEFTLPTTGRMNSVAFSPDGSLLATAGSETAIRLYDPRSGTEIRRLEVHIGTIDVTFSPDGKTLASSCVDGSIRLWRPSTGEQVGAIAGHSRHPLFLSFSPDGTMLASGSWDKRIWIWEVATGEMVQSPIGHDDIIRGVAFSPDGSRVVSASYDGTARLGRVAGANWSRARQVEDLAGAVGSRAASLGQGHRLSATGVSFSPDGRLLATSGYDQSARVWQVATGEEEQVLL